MALFWEVSIRRLFSCLKPSRERPKPIYTDLLCPTDGPPFGGACSQLDLDPVCIKFLRAWIFIAFAF